MPANKRINDKTYEAKMRSAPELENMLDAMYYTKREPNRDINDPEKKDITYYDYYDLLIRLKDAWYDGEVSIGMNEKLGPVFYELSKLKENTVVGTTHGLASKQDGASSNDVYTDIIDDDADSVNGKSFSLKSDSGTFFEELGADADAQEAGRLIDNLMASRGKMGFETGEWKGKTSAIAKQILEETGSEYGQAALTGRINKAYEAIDRAGSDRAAIMSYCYDIGKTVAAKAGEAAELDTARQEARNYLRNTKIYLNAEMQSEVASAYGSVRAFMQRNFGKAKFTTNKNKSPANLLNFIPHNIAFIYGT